MIIILLFLISFCTAMADAPDETQVMWRPAFYADSLYPADTNEYIDAFTEYMTRDEAQNSALLKVLITPHSSFSEASKVYSMTYDYIRGVKYDGIIIIGQAIAAPFKGISIYNGYGYETPFGSLKNDTSLAKIISSQRPEILFGQTGHYNINKAQEFNIELQLPAIKYLYPNASVVSIMIGNDDLNNISILTEALDKSLDTSKNYLIIATAELSYSKNFKLTKEYDMVTLEQAEDFNYVNLINTYKNKFWESKSAIAFISGIMAAERLKSNYMLPIMYYIPEINDNDRETSDTLGHGIIGAAFVINADVHPKEAPYFDGPYAQQLIEEVKKSVIRAIVNDSTPPAHLFPRRFGSYTPVAVEIIKDGKVIGSALNFRSIDPMFLAVNITGREAAREAIKNNQLKASDSTTIKLRLYLFSQAKKLYNIGELSENDAVMMEANGKQIFFKKADILKEEYFEFNSMLSNSLIYKSAFTVIEEK